MLNFNDNLYSPYAIVITYYIILFIIINAEANDVRKIGLLM